MDKISQVMERYRLSAGRGGMPLSYAELGRRIGVSRTQAENFCKGRSIPSDEAILRISEEIGYDEMRLLVLQHHDRAPPKVKPAWRKIMERLETHEEKSLTMDPQLLELFEERKKVPTAVRAALVNLAQLFLGLRVSFQEHLVELVEKWTADPEVLEKDRSGPSGRNGG